MSRYAFGRTYARIYASLQERDRKKHLSEIRDILRTAWEHAIKRLQREMLKATDNISNEAVRAQISQFPLTLRYVIQEETGHVSILSNDPYLERVLHYGTREVPAIKPIELLVKFLHESVLLEEIVFTARDFTHETRNPKTSSSNT